MSNGIGDFITSTKEIRRLAAQVMAELKGDVPGHEFHGNQYSDGGGSSGGESKSMSGSDYAKEIGSSVPAEHLKIINSVSEGSTLNRSQNQSGNIVIQNSNDKQRTFAHEVGHSVLMKSPDRQHVERVVFNTPQAKALARRGGKWSSYEHLTHELFSEMYADKYTGRGRVKIDKSVSDAIDKMRVS